MNSSAIKVFKQKWPNPTFSENTVAKSKLNLLKKCMSIPGIWEDCPRRSIRNYLSELREISTATL